MNHFEQATRASALDRTIGEARRRAALEHATYLGPAVVDRAEEAIVMGDAERRAATYPSRSGDAHEHRSGLLGRPQVGDEPLGIAAQARIVMRADADVPIDLRKATRTALLAVFQGPEGISPRSLLPEGRQPGSWSSSAPPRCAILSRTVSAAQRRTTKPA